jgi:Domain of unknown function (DUF4145)
MQNAIITDSQFSSGKHEFHNNNKEGNLLLRSQVTVCPNPNCKEYTIVAGLHKETYENGRWIIIPSPFLTWHLKPQSNAKPFPDYIPEPIRKDYEEAFLIRDLSPKASATLSRRCLQGIIRDYWGVSRNRLVDEIADIQEKVDPLTWTAIDAVRKIGNIGAHMEKDINVIVDVEPREAKLLIDLIEILFKDWYIARHERELRVQAVVDTAKKKQSDKQVQPTDKAIAKE